MSAATVLETLVVRFTADATQYDRIVESIENKVQSASARLTSLGVKASLALSAPLAGIKALSLSAFSDFDDAMTKSLAIMSGVNASVRKNMEDEAKRIALTTSTAPAKAAEAYYFLASAGMSAEQAIKAVGAVNQFSIAGAFDLATATEMLADAHSSLGLRVNDATQNMKNLTRVSDVLVDAANASNASVAQFSQALTTKAGASARLLKKDVEEVTAVLAVYADQGVKGALAGERASILMRELQRSSISARQEWARLNITAFDSRGKFLHLADIIKQLESRMMTMSDKQRRQTITQLGMNDMAADAIMPLLGLSSEISRYEARLRSAGGATADVAEKQMKSFANQAAIMKNNISVMAIEIGAVLAPIMSKMNEMTIRAISFWRSLDDVFKEHVIYVSLAATMIGPFLLALAGVLRIGGSLTTGLMGLGKIGFVGLFSPLRLVSILLGGVSTSFNAVAAAANNARYAATSSVLRMAGGGVAAMGRGMGAVGSAFSPMGNIAADAARMDAALSAAYSRVRTITQSTVASVSQYWASFTNGLSGNIGLATTRTARAFWMIGDAIRSPREAWRSFSTIVQNGARAMVSAADRGWISWQNANRIILKSVQSTWTSAVSFVRSINWTAVYTATWQTAGIVAARSITLSMATAFRTVQSMARLTGMVIRSMGGGLVTLLSSFSMIGMVLSSVGGSVGTVVSSLLPIAMIAPALISVVGVFASWPFLLGAAVGAWALLTDSGKEFTSWLSTTFAGTIAGFDKALGGVINALKDGKIGEASKIAWLGLKIVFFRGMTELGDDWVGFARGLVETFRGATQMVGEGWITMIGSLTSGMIKMAQQEGAVGDLMSKVLGVDLRIAKAEREKMEAELGPLRVKNLKWSIEQNEKILKILKEQGLEQANIASGGSNWKTVEEAEKKLTQSITEFSKELGIPAQTFEETMNAALKDTQDSMKKSWDAKMGAMSASSDKFFGGLEESAKNAEAELAKLLQTQEDQKVEKQLKGALSSTMGWLQSTFTGMKAWVDEKTKVDAAATPVIVKFGVEGVEALEAGSAKAERALRAYRLAATQPVVLGNPAAGGVGGIAAKAGALIGGIADSATGETKTKVTDLLSLIKSGIDRIATNSAPKAAAEAKKLAFADFAGLFPDT